MKDDVISGTLETKAIESAKITDAVMNGEELTFTVESESMRGVVLEFDVNVKKESMSGKVRFNLESLGRTEEFRWKAERV